MSRKLSATIFKKVIVSTLSILMGCTNVPTLNNQISSLTGSGQNLTLNTTKGFGIKSTTNPNLVRKIFLDKTAFKREKGKPDTQIKEFEVTKDDLTKAVYFKCSYKS